jgi:serine/threonine protein kinase
MSEEKKKANEEYVYANRYHSGDFIDAGSYSWVAKAFDLKLRRTVCIKVARTIEGANYDDRVRLFRTEAELGASLFHPNIVRVLDFCFMGCEKIPEGPILIEECGEPIIVMDYIEGVNFLILQKKTNYRFLVLWILVLKLPKHWFILIIYLFLSFIEIFGKPIF